MIPHVRSAAPVPDRVVVRVAVAETMEALTDALVAPTFLAPSAPTSRGIFLQGAASTARTAGKPEVGRSVGKACCGV